MAAALRQELSPGFVPNLLHTLGFVRQYQLLQRERLAGEARQHGDARRPQAPAARLAALSRLLGAMPLAGRHSPPTTSGLPGVVLSGIPLTAETLAMTATLGRKLPVSVIGPVFSRDIMTPHTKAGERAVNRKPDRITAMQQIIDAVKAEFPSINRIPSNAGRTTPASAAPRS